MHALPMRNVVLVQVFECGETLFHDHGGLFLTQGLSLDDEIEKFTALAITIRITNMNFGTR